MAALSIRNLDERVKRQLRLRAARNGRSMEAEVRAILEEAVSAPEEGANPFELFMAAFAEVGGVELELPDRSIAAPGVDFS